MLEFCYLTTLGSIFTLILVIFKSVLIKKYGGSWYYYIWILVLISFCFPYKLDIFQYLYKTPQQNIYTPVFEQNITFQNLTQSNNLISTNNTYHLTVSIEQILYTVYFIGFFAFTVYYILCYYIFLKGLKKTIKEALNTQYLNCLNDICSEMGISKTIKLKQSYINCSPMLIGIINPTIILSTKDYTINEVSMIFKHELTHYKRNDIIYKLFALIVHIIHWFNPISYLALHNINEACEYSCDEAITKKMNEQNKREYGYMLLNQIQSDNSNNLFLTKFVYNNKNILKRRINIIMNDKKYKRVQITLISVLALILCSNFFNLNSINAKEIVQNNEPRKLGVYIPKSEIISTSEEEIQAIYKLEDSSRTNVYKETRSLTDSEQDRLKILRQYYIYGDKKPQRELPLKSGDYDVYFDLENGIFFYPERELTDDELLQIIAWRQKVNLVLSIRYHLEAETTIPENIEINETKAVELAAQSITNLFDVDFSTNSFTVNAVFSQPNSISPNKWQISVTPNYKDKVSDWNYMVWIDAITGEISTLRSNPTYEWTIIDENDKESIYNDKSWIDKAKSIIVQKQKESAKIKEVYIVDNNSNIKNDQRTVDIKLVLDNGSSYIVYLFYPDQSLRGILYTPNK